MIDFKTKKFNLNNLILKCFWIIFKQINFECIHVVWAIDRCTCENTHAWSIQLVHIICDNLVFAGPHVV